MVKLQTFASFMQSRFHRSAESHLTDFMSRQQGHLMLGGRVDLNVLAARYGAPLEVAYLPQITRQVHAMMGWAAQAARVTSYAGTFLYAYATKANFAADVVRTALEAGAHYETSAAADVEIAHHLWKQGILKSDRLLICNGSKEAHYTDAILRLRRAGYAHVISVLDDLEEFAALRACPLPMQFGLREREAGNRDGAHPGNDRFGLTTAEMNEVIAGLAGTPHAVVMYHAMIGSQVENADHFLATLRASIRNYCQLRQRVPTLRFFNYGGGTPTSGYRLDFEFDYTGFLTLLMEEMRALCAEYQVPVPDLVGEFGRYTVANHSVFLFDVGQVKRGGEGQPDWYLINGSLMVSAPDSVLVPDQRFIILPLEGWDRPLRPVRLGSRRTCDSDDVYPRPGNAPLLLPDSGVGTLIAVCGIGAYQQMISGRGGAHHCLSPEPRRIIFEEKDGRLIQRVDAAQSQAEMMRLIGYQPARQPAPALPLHPPLWAQPTVNRRVKTMRLRQRPLMAPAGIPT